jgi:hypothetical protein
MEKPKNEPINEQQRRNIQLGEDRMQLLDTIREMIDIEFERRKMPPEGNPHPEKPPPKNLGREPASPQPTPRTLWQRILSFFRP